MITVVNKYQEPNNIYCGRGSPLGNPFVLKEPHKGNLINARRIKENKEERDAVCERYIWWFNKKLKEEGNTVFKETLMWLEAKARRQDINLGCFCAPKRCHCDTIKQYLEDKIRE